MKVTIDLISKTKDGTVSYLTGFVHPGTHKEQKRRKHTVKGGKTYYSYFRDVEPLKYEVYIDEHKKVLAPNKIYELIIDYPVTRPFITKIKGPKTLRQVVDFAVKQYRKMYELERKTSKKKEQNIPGMFNRAQTDGKFGIYGHNLGDLSIDSVRIKGNKIYLGVSS